MQTLRLLNLAYIFNNTILFAYSLHEYSILWQHTAFRDIMIFMSNYNSCIFNKVSRNTRHV